MDDSFLKRINSQSDDENDNREKFVPRASTSSSRDDDEMPKAGPSRVIKKLSRKRDDVSRSDLQILKKMLQQLPIEQANEASCSSQQEILSEVESQQETYDEVEFIQGYHSVVYSKDNPMELELISSENVSAHHMRLCPVSQFEVPNLDLEFTFNQLAAELKDLKLPDPSWRIMIALKGRKIIGITFTNSFDFAERSVAFKANSINFDIIIEGCPAVLVGTPKKVTNKGELETLLRIVESIDNDNVMIRYKTEFSE